MHSILIAIFSKVVMNAVDVRKRTVKSRTELADLYVLQLRRLCDRSWHLPRSLSEDVTPAILIAFTQTVQADFKPNTAFRAWRMGLSIPDSLAEKTTKHLNYMEL